MKKICAALLLVLSANTAWAGDEAIKGPLHEASIDDWLRGSKADRLVTSVYWVDSYLKAENMSASREDQLAVMAFGVVQCLDQTYLSDETLEILPKMASLVCVKSLVGK